MAFLTPSEIDGIVAENLFRQLQDEKRKPDPQAQEAREAARKAQQERIARKRATG